MNYNKKLSLCMAIIICNSTSIFASGYKLSRAEEIPRDPFTLEMSKLKQKVSTLELQLQASEQSRQREVDELTAKNTNQEQKITELSKLVLPALGLLKDQVLLQQNLNEQIQASLEMLEKVAQDHLK